MQIQITFYWNFNVALHVYLFGIHPPSAPYASIVILMKSCIQHTY